MKRITKLVAAAFGAVAMFVGSARADYKLETDETWTDFTGHPGTIDLAGHKLTVSSLAGTATVTNSADAGYEILEYLEGDGKAYVDTGVSPHGNTVVDLKMQLIKDLGSSSAIYVGSRDTQNTSGKFACYVIPNSGVLKHYWCGANGEGWAGGNIAVNTDYTVHLDANGPCTLNSEPFATCSGVDSGLDIFVFGANLDGKASNVGPFRVYYCRIAYGDAVQCDLKPARRLSDGALGLLDVKDPEKLVFHEKQGSGAFTAGPLASDEFVKKMQIAELHVNVAGGQTEEFKTVVISGPVRVVKEGAGTLMSGTVKQYNTCGWDVAAGTVKPSGGLWGKQYFGVEHSKITVRTGATYDINGMTDSRCYDFVLDGGTIVNTGKDITDSYGCMGRIMLTKDSALNAQSSFSVLDGAIDLNGYRLDVDIGSGKCFYLRGEFCTVKNGTFNIKSGGYMQTYIAKDNLRDMTTADFVLGSGLSLASGMAVRNLTVVYNSTIAYGVNKAMIYGVFTPTSDYINNFELQDGATLNLADLCGPYNLKSTLTSQSLGFAAGLTTINLALGTRVLENGMQLIGWTDADAPLSTVDFKLPDTVNPDDFMLRRRSDGLYVEATVKTAVWTGAADTTDCTDPANWDCFDANDKKIADALPGSITAVTLSGAVQLDILANSFSCASFTCENVSLKGDCDWSGLGQPVNGPIDLAGHKLTVSSLMGNATVTSSADAGYEILEYLESDGNAYVNTGVPPLYNTVVDLKMRLIKDLGSSSAIYVGSRDTKNASGKFACYVIPNSGVLKHYWCGANKEGWAGGNVAVNTDYTVHLDANGSCTLNGESFATCSGVDSGLDIFVFGANLDGKASNVGPFRVYYCRIAYGDVLQCDLKPARRLSDGALGLLDVKDSEKLVFHEKQGSGAFTAGPVVSDEFVKKTQIAELHVNVADGQTATITTLAINGPVRVVKEGAGTLMSGTVKQYNTCGWDVAAGTVKPSGGLWGKQYFGVEHTKITVRTGATYDINGMTDSRCYDFVLDGGTILNTGKDITDSYGCMGRITLTKDSALNAQSSFSVMDVIDLNGYTLDVDVGSNSKYLYLTGELGNLTNGTFNVKGWCWQISRGSSRDMRTVDCVVDSILSLQVGIAVRNLTAVCNSTTAYGTGKAMIYGVFTPTSDYINNFELQDGATLNLAGRSDAYNLTSSLTGQTLGFAEGVPTVQVALGDRKVRGGEQVVAWEAGSKPNVKFIPEAGAKYRLSVRDDGLYAEKGFMITVH